MVNIPFDKKTFGGVIKNENMSNKELAEELHKPITTKIFFKKIHSRQYLWWWSCWYAINK